MSVQHGLQINFLIYQSSMSSDYLLSSERFGEPCLSQFLTPKHSVVTPVSLIQEPADIYEKVKRYK